MSHAERNKEKQQKQQPTTYGNVAVSAEKEKSNNWEHEISERIIDDNVDLINELNVDVDVDIDVMDVPAQKPHFLDYDAVPPADLEEHFTKALTLGGIKNVNKQRSNEIFKVDKKFELDGEISDFELAASGFTKKELTQDASELRGANSTCTSLRKNIFGKPKHFLDENPIPPDYMLENEIREHRSLDRNFERQVEQQASKDFLNNAPANSLRNERKSSLERGSHALNDVTSATRASRERLKANIPWESVPSFLNTASSTTTPLTANSIPKGAAWTIDYNGTSISCPTKLELESAGPRVECVYSLLSMLGSTDPLDMSKKFFELSRSAETCVTLRRSGCIPLLVQMMHANEVEDGVRKYANMALHNVFHSNPDEKSGRRELKVLRLLDKINEYCSFLKTLLQSGGETIADDTDRHPLAAISSLMKVSFDEEHRHTMCQLGALYAIPNLVHLDHAAHGPKPEYDTNEAQNSGDEACKPGLSQGRGCNSLRRYALMALTNLTFGDENNKAQLCSQKPFMEALIAQLDSAPDDLLQVTASVLRNLSWRADKNMKSVLNEIGTITALARAAMKNKNENTLKAILSALWNLSAHCSTNKAEFCAVDGALAFLVDMLTYEGPSKTLKIIENAGGILHNVSSHIAVCENYRQILRERNCLAILLQQLKSESLTVVSNSCGTLWNLSARCPEDQKFLWDNGAVPMLRSLIHSKHKMISEGSSSALKNLLNFRPSAHNHIPLDPIARSLGLKKLPTLDARKQRALKQELVNKAHAETCENLDNHLSETACGTKENSNVENGFDDALYARRLTRSAMLTKSESRDSILSAKSDTTYEHLLRSHSASEAQRGKNQRIPAKIVPYNVQRAVYVLKGEVVESTEDVEQPIDYSVKYNETSNTIKNNVNNEAVMNNTQTRKARMPSPVSYQETDLDQPTDFSLRYAENQTESDIEHITTQAEIIENKNITKTTLNNVKVATTSTTTITTTATEISTNTNNAEIMLILEDTVKCYQTEDTPYVISNAASITDLRQVPSGSSKCENPMPTQSVVKSNSSATANKDNTSTQATITTTTHFANQAQIVNANSATNFTSGTYTPEKPINYCEEGTPGYFSRYDSLSSLDELTANIRKSNELTNSNNFAIEPCKLHEASTSCDDAQKIALKTEPLLPQNTAPISNIPTTPSTNINSAQETPLMFSRHSSMDSLIAEDEEIVHCDDISSVVSDFSRLASGVISPSEIPDSPTQSMPQSPRRNSVIVEHQSLNAADEQHVQIEENQNNQIPLRSVFEDDLNTFHVENTPAQFSCATSLSNLSFAEDSIPVAKLSKPNTSGNVAKNNEKFTQLQLTNAVSEGEEESTNYNDDDLLASCINIGMHRFGTTFEHKKDVATTSNQQVVQKTTFDETTKQYFTEDTPALLSKVGSNSNLSAISICSSAQGNNDIYKVENEVEFVTHTDQRRSLNLSDDVSSNASESGVNAAVVQSDILQQCIRDGMQKKKTTINRPKSKAESTDPIAMLRRGGSALPRYLPVADEMNKYLVEGSPCAFSVMSGLSNLTVGSSLVGPAIQLKDCAVEINKEKISEETLQLNAQEVEAPASVEPQWQDDSLSSLSIESEDDANLLSQAFAAGCNRPISNLGFNSSNSLAYGGKQTTSLSVSQPLSINLSHHKTRIGSNSNSNVNGNESFSSVDSCDSNDNQSKSLLELCILSGKNKGRNKGNNIRQHHNHSHHHQHHNQRAGLNAATNNASTQSNPNLKQFDSLPLQLNVTAMLRPKHTSTNRHLREREKSDDKLLLECINTGISSKIVGSSSSSTSLKMQHTKAFENLNNENRLHRSSEECAMANCLQPKNVQATSAAALNVEAEVLETNIANSTAATDVEQKQIELQQQQQYDNKNYNSSNYNNTQGDNTGEAVKPTALILPTEDAVLDVVKLQNQKTTQCLKTNVIGFDDDDEKNNVESVMTTSLDNTNSSSDDSNESFIIETTVSMVEQTTPQQQCQTNLNSSIVEKHKDPELMLRSVERLTLEFVSSAEQLRTHGSAENSREFRRGSLSIGNVGGGSGGTSNNTWNEDTHPNDVSFPSVSITAPFINSSLTGDDDELNDVEDVEQATEADGNNLNDFNEMTPTNEENNAQCFANVDEVILFTTNETAQLHSLENETETLINEELKQQTHELTQNSGSSISFKLGGAVQTAAAAMHTQHNAYTTHSMTNSTIIANEARALAENLLRSHDEAEDLTFSMNSLDLDNIRPPSGMESLNASGYFSHEQFQIAQTTQPNSLPKYINNSNNNKSPKFARKALPAGLVARRALAQHTGSTESVNSSFNLLENIKPPSFMDELLDSMISVASIQSEVADGCESMATTVSLSNYETATADGNQQTLADTQNDNDDNTVTLHSCCELTWQCDDEPDDDDDKRSVNKLNQDSSGGGVTPLPTHEHFSSAETTPRKTLLDASPTNAAQQIRRSLTPKMKRKLAKERFKTYTISTLTDDTNLSSLTLENEQEEEMLKIEIIDTSPSINSNDDVGGSINRRRRRTSQERYKTQTIVYKSTAQVNVQTNDVNELQEAEHISLTSTDECLSDELSSIRAMTKQFTHITETLEVLNTEVAELNITEQAQNSETESCHADAYDEHVEENELTATKKPLVVGVGAAIVKIPNEEFKLENSNLSTQVKVVRGRKKPTYVSPYSKQYQRSNTAPVTRLATNKTTSNNLLNGGATFLRKRNTNASTSCLNSKVALKKKNVVTNLTTPQTQPSPPLERQGTFVKEEPTLAHKDVPIVEVTANKSKSLLPIASPKRIVSKLPTKRTTTTTTPASPQKLTTIAKVNNTRKVLPAISPSKPLRSNSNTNIRTTSNIAAIRIARVSTTTPPTRSNSNLNTNNGDSANIATKINQAQSRIASMWKRVNEAKSGTTKSTTSNLKATPHTKSSTSIHTQQTQQIQQQQQLIRSSTFDDIEKPTTTTSQKRTQHALVRTSDKIALKTATKLNVSKNTISSNLATTTRLEKRTAHK